MIGPGEGRVASWAGLGTGVIARDRRDCYGQA